MTILILPQAFSDNSSGPPQLIRNVEDSSLELFVFQALQLSIRDIVTCQKDWVKFFGVENAETPSGQFLANRK